MLTFDLGDGAHLRLCEERDATEIFALVDVNRARLREWLPWVDRNTDPSHTLKNIRDGRRQLARNDGMQLVLVVGGRIAGRVGHHGIDWENGVTELGYWLGRAYEGRGLMTRAVAALVDDAFGARGLARVVIRCHTENRRSRAIPERLGFVEEEIERSAALLNGKRVDQVVYAKLASS